MQTDDVIDPGLMVDVPVNELSGDALNWVAFDSLYHGLTPTIRPTIRRLPEQTHNDVTFPGGTYLTWSLGHETRQLWSPTSDEHQAGIVIDRFGIASRRHSSGNWHAMLSSDLGDGVNGAWRTHTFHGGERYGRYSYQVSKRQQVFSDTSRRVACLRAAVAHVHGEKVSVPALLLENSHG